MTELFQAIVNGLQMGFLYALVAVGLAIIWGLMEMINFAHGEFLMLGMFGAWWLSHAVGLDPLLSIVPLGLAMYGFGAGSCLVAVVIGSQNRTVELSANGLHGPIGQIFFAPGENEQPPPPPKGQ